MSLIPVSNPSRSQSDCLSLYLLAIVVAKVLMLRNHSTQIESGVLIDSGQTVTKIGQEWLGCLLADPAC